jgi:hypothetical protein
MYPGVTFLLPFVPQGENCVKFPYSIAHVEATHPDPVGPTLHAPQALESLDESMHEPEHSTNPGRHSAKQVSLAVHESVALTVVLHDVHDPPQQIPLVPHTVPSTATPVAAHVC